MDRTKEFYAFYDSVLSRRLKSGKINRSEISKGYADTVSGSLVRPAAATQPAKKPAKSGKFFTTVAQIGEDINSCKIRLSSLLKYVNRRTLFDDQPARINELVSVIKRDIEQIGRGIVASSKILGDKADSDIGAANSQTRLHAKNALSCLETDFSRIREEFKRILDIRSHNLNEQRLRRQEYFHHDPDQSSSNRYRPVPSSYRGPESSKISPNLRERLKPGSRGSGLASGITSSPALNEPSNLVPLQGGLSSRLQQKMETTSESALDLEIAESKSKEIDLIETTVIELGQMYQNFSNMVALQGQSIRRIDDNLNDVELNVSGAHAQLSKYYKSISSNRWLIVKILAVLLFFFVVFVIIT